MCIQRCLSFSFFFFHDPATTKIYTLSLHDALPILASSGRRTSQKPNGSCWVSSPTNPRCITAARSRTWDSDRKSTRLNSSHQIISYAVFCLKKKKKKKQFQRRVVTYSQMHVIGRLC